MSPTRPSEGLSLLTSTRHDAPRCECGALLHVKLSRDERGAIVRETYCANDAAHRGGLDVTATAERRAHQLAAAARELSALGAA